MDDVDKILKQLNADHLKRWNKHCTKLKESLEPYLRKEGKIIPVNFRSFYIWYRERYKNMNFYNIPLPKEEDFIRYHEYMRSKLEKKNNKGGRKFDYAIEDTKKWFNELSQKKEYQRSNGEPYIKLITQQIKKFHKEKTGNEPSDDTIKNHRRKLGLMQNKPKGE